MIQTRKPTGKPSWPLTLAAGGEGSGKSYLAALASASPLIERTYWIGYGEQDPDEYGLIPGANFDIVQHDGTVNQVKTIVKEIASQPKADKPTLIVLDSGTKLWDAISENAQIDANRRAARKGNNGGDATIGVDIWNHHKAHWRAIIDALRSHDGPVIITARYEEVAEIVKGKPTGDKVWKVKAEKGLPYDVDVVIHMPERGKYIVSKARSVRLALAGKMDRPQEWPGFTMDAFWRALGLHEVETAPSQYATPVQEVDESGRDWLAELEDADGDPDLIRALGLAARSAAAAPDVLEALRTAFVAAKAQVVPEAQAGGEA
jgi:hypothetical protein